MWFIIKRDRFKKIIVFFLLAVIFLAAFGLLGRKFIKTDLGSDYKGDLDSLNRYELDVSLDPVKLALEGELIFTYTNLAQSAEEQLLFHLFPNAFSSPESTPYEKNYLLVYYPDGFSSGFLEVEEITDSATGQGLPFRIEGLNLWVDLNQPLASGETTSLNIKFKEQIPSAVSRFGGYGNLISLGNWYPILAVKQDGQWQTTAYLPWGDPFYSRIAFYEVKFTVPKEYKLVHTGKRLESEDRGDKVTYRLEGELVRDFALALSPNYELKSEKVGKTNINSYYLPEAEQYGLEALRLAKQALSFFNEKFGVYPYEELTVVQANLLNGGMEYPQLVMIGKNLYSKPYQEAKVLEFVLVHEIAHQWWYGLVGSDELKEPWLDEGLTNYSTLLYMEAIYGKQETEKLKKRFIELPTQERNPVSLDQPLTEYRDAESYYTNVYGRGALAVEELHSILGDRKFDQVMQAYFKTYKYGECSIEEFLCLAEKEGKVDLTGFKHKYFPGN